MRVDPVTAAFDAIESAYHDSFQKTPLAEEARRRQDTAISCVPVAAHRWADTPSIIRPLLHRLHHLAVDGAKQRRSADGRCLPRARIEAFASGTREPTRRLSDAYVDLDRPDRGWRQFERAALRVLDSAGTPFHGTVVLCVGIDRDAPDWVVGLQVRIADPRAAAPAFRPLKAELVTERRARRLVEESLALERGHSLELAAEVPAILHEAAGVLQAAGGVSPARPPRATPPDHWASAGRALGGFVGSALHGWGTGNGNPGAPPGPQQVPRPPSPVGPDLESRPFENERTAGPETSSPGSATPSASRAVGVCHTAMAAGTEERWRSARLPFGLELPDDTCTADEPGTLDVDGACQPPDPHRPPMGLESYPRDADVVDWDSRTARWMEVRSWAAVVSMPDGVLYDAVLVGLPGEYRLIVKSDGQEVFSSVRQGKVDRARGLDVHIQRWVRQALTEWISGAGTSSDEPEDNASGREPTDGWRLTDVVWQAPGRFRFTKAACMLYVQWRPGHWYIGSVREGAPAAGGTGIPGPMRRPQRLPESVYPHADTVARHHGIVLGFAPQHSAPLGSGDTLVDVPGEQDESPSAPDGEPPAATPPSPPDEVHRTSAPGSALPADE